MGQFQFVFVPFSSVVVAELFVFVPLSSDVVAELSVFVPLASDVVAELSVLLPFSLYQSATFLLRSVFVRIRTFRFVAVVISLRDGLLFVCCSLFRA